MKPWVVRTQKQVAEFFGVRAQTVRQWRQDGMPGAAKAWDLREIFEWWKRRLGKVERATSQQEESEGEKALARSRAARAELDELELQRQLGEVVDLHDVHEFADLIASKVRSAGEAIRRMHGDGAYSILDGALAELEDELRRRFGDAPDS